MKKIIILILLVFILSGCATVYNPATGRHEEISAFITPAVEAILGAYYYAQMCRTYGGNVYTNTRLNRIGRNIVAISDRKRDFNYRFLVVNDSAPNAFTASGGYIYVTKGLLDMATDDELACIIAHELGHDACRHMAKRIPALIGFYAINKMLSKKESRRDIQQIVGVMYTIISNGYSRQDEREADKLAVRYTKRVGYNPEAFITFFEKLQKKYPRPYIAFLSSHPSTSERIRNARIEIASLNSRSNHTSFASKRAAEDTEKPRIKMALPATSPKTALSFKDGKLELPKKALAIK